MNNKKGFDEQLEDVGGKAAKLIEKKAIEYKPKAEKLLAAFSTWLDKKLAQ